MTFDRGPRTDLSSDWDPGEPHVRLAAVDRRIQARRNAGRKRPLARSTSRRRNLNARRIIADNAAAMNNDNIDRRKGDFGERIMGRFLTPAGVATLACLLCGAGPAMAQPAAPDTSMENLPGLSDRAASGSVQCPDGSTRPFWGEAPSDLTIAMLCDVAADVAAARAAQADAAVEAKNTEAEQRAALAGQSGVAAGLEATAKTGRPDFLLAQPWVWFVGAVLAIFGLGAFFGMFRKRP